MNEALLCTAIKCVEAAGKILTNYFGQIHEISQKSDSERDIVTNVDILVEKKIKQIILNQFPEHNIIGEESDNLENNSEYCWVLDPLDGTINYLRGIPLCAVSIALEKNREIIVGAIHNPFS